MSSILKTQRGVTGHHLHIVLVDDLLQCLRQHHCHSRDLVGAEHGSAPLHTLCRCVRHTGRCVTRAVDELQVWRFVPTAVMQPLPGQKQFNSKKKGGAAPVLLVRLAMAFGLALRSGKGSYGNPECRGIDF